MGDAATCSKTYNEFLKFGKFFTTRLVQALVQSRLGQPVVQNCSVQPDISDWFSVRIDELGEIAAQLRTSVSKYPPNVENFTLDFLLHTADGDILPLESWTIGFDSGLLDASINIRTEMYHQLGTLLKSVMVASRMTPVYRYYARKQSPETFIIMYQIYERTPEMDLGEGQQKIRIGSVASPFGGFHVDLSYRTKMEISPTVHEVEIVPEVSLSAKEKTKQESTSRETVAIPFGPVPVYGSAIETVSPVSDLISIFSVSPAEQGVDALTGTSPRRVHFHLGRSRSSSDDSYNHHHTNSGSGEENIFGFEMSDMSPYSSSLPYRRCLSVRNRVRTHSFPFSTLLASVSHNLSSSEQLPRLVEDNGNSTPTSPTNQNTTSVTADSQFKVQRTMHQCATASSEVSLMDEPKIVDELGDEPEAEVASDDDEMTSSDDSYVKVAFGSSESLADGLGEFMKQCRSAPTHLSFQADSTSVIPELLAQFKNNQEVFDSFVAEVRKKTLCDDDL